MVSLDLIKVFLARLTVPVLPSILLPVVDCRLASRDPGVVVRAATAIEDLAARIGLLDTSVFGPVNHGGFVRPVVVAVA